jgi:hypothetical protein
MPNRKVTIPNPVGALKAIDGLFAQERCLRGLESTETDHEREQIRDVMGRISSPNGLTSLVVGCHLREIGAGRRRQ